MQRVSIRCQRLTKIEAVRTVLFPDAATPAQIEEVARQIDQDLSFDAFSPVAEYVRPLDPVLEAADRTAKPDLILPALGAGESAVQAFDVEHALALLNTISQERVALMARLQETAELAVLAGLSVKDAGEALGYTEAQAKKLLNTSDES